MRFIPHPLRRTLVAGAALAASTCALALPLDFDVSGVGYYNPASALNNDVEVVTGVNSLLTWFNGGANPNGGAVTFTLDAGSGLPAPTLPAPVSFGYKDEQAPFGEIDSSVYEYVLGKYGNTAFLFYLGNLPAGLYSLPANLGGASTTQNGLSHFVAFNAPRQNVPDGGNTLALLGAALVGIAAVRRRHPQPIPAARQP